MQTRFLITLATIARANSFAKAAAELNSTLSTVSMQMKSLETELGITLFDRSFRPPQFTPLGRKIAKQALNLLNEHDRLVRLCDHGDSLNGIYRLGFIGSASVRILPQFLKRAANKAPGASFEIETGLSEALESRVAAGQLDGAVVTGSSKPQPGVSYFELTREPLVLAQPVEMGNRLPDGNNPALPFLQFNRNTGVGKIIESYRQEHLPWVSSIIVLDSIEAIMECVREGIGFTLLPEPDIRRYGRQSIACPILEGPEVLRSIVLAYSHQSNRARDMKRVAEILLDEQTVDP